MNINSAGLLCITMLARVALLSLATKKTPCCSSAASNLPVTGQPTWAARRQDAVGYLAAKVAVLHRVGFRHLRFCLGRAPLLSDSAARQRAGADGGQQQVARGVKLVVRAVERAPNDHAIVGHRRR